MGVRAVPAHDPGMQTAAPTVASPVREALPVLAISAVIVALSSLDQSTRGPSLTGLFLAHLNLFF